MADMSRFSPFATPFQGRLTSEALSILELREASAVPQAADLEFMNNHRFGNFGLLDSQYQPQQNSAGIGPDQLLAAQANIWAEDTSIYKGGGSENTEIINYINVYALAYFKSILSQEQLAILLTLSPSELCEKLMEVAKNHNAQRPRGRRMFYNECAFCKNNGENEEQYSSHALKDWRGRVLCPVLRSFHCPRCGATGDRAHTIKYCPHNVEHGGSLLRRRRASLNSLLMGSATSATSPASATALHHSSPWTNFEMN